METADTKTGTTRQERQLLATLLTNVDWGRIPAEASQALIADPQRAGEIITAALSQGLAGMPANESPTGRFKPHWRVQDSIVFADLHSPGWKAGEWLAWFKGNRYRLIGDVKSVLSSDDFRPSSAGALRRIAIVTNGGLPPGEWTESNARAQAASFGYGPARLETACAFRRAFSDKEIRSMGLHWVTAAHKPVDGLMLTAGNVDSGRWLMAHRPSKEEWPFYNGFIYELE